MSLISDALKKLERERKRGFPIPPMIPGGGGGQSPRNRTLLLALITVFLAIVAYGLTQMTQRPAPPLPPRETQRPSAPAETLQISPAETLTAEAPPQPSKEDTRPQGPPPDTIARPPARKKAQEEKIPVEVTLRPITPEGTQPPPPPRPRHRKGAPPAPSPQVREEAQEEARRLFRLGQMRMRGKDFIGAIEAFRKALKLVPDYREARIALSAALIHAGKFAEAEQELLPLVEFNPSPSALLNYALALRGLGREGEAIEVVERILAIYPGYAPAHLLRGELLEAEEAFEEAAQSFLAAYQADPTHILALYRAARAFDLAGQRSEALRYYRLFVSHPNPASPALREQVWARISYLEGLHEGPG